MVRLSVLYEEKYVFWLCKIGNYRYLKTRFTQYLMWWKILAILSTNVYNVTFALSQEGVRE